MARSMGCSRSLAERRMELPFKTPHPSYVRTKFSKGSISRGVGSKRGTITVGFRSRRRPLPSRGPMKSRLRSGSRLRGTLNRGCLGSFSVCCIVLHLSHRVLHGFDLLGNALGDLRVGIADG